MKLHGSRTSPYVRKVRVTLEEAGIAHEFIVCNSWEADSYVKRLNPLGKVPVLETGDGEVLCDSLAIVEHLAARGLTDAVPPEAGDRLAVLRWHVLGHGLIDCAVAQVLEGRRPAEMQSDEIFARELDRMARALRAAEDRLPDAPFVCGKGLTLADITLAVALQYIDVRLATPWRDDCPRLADWLVPVSLRPAFADTMPPAT